MATVRIRPGEPKRKWRLRPTRIIAMLLGAYGLFLFHYLLPRFQIVTVSNANNDDIDEAMAYVKSIKSFDRHLNFLHIPKTAGTAVEYAAGKHKVSWGSCQFNHKPRVRQAMFLLLELVINYTKSNHLCSPLALYLSIPGWRFLARTRGMVACTSTVLPHQTDQPLPQLGAICHNP